MQLCRKKGLCFTCDEKFTWNHICPIKHALLLMTSTDESDFSALIEHSEEKMDATSLLQQTQEPHLSLNLPITIPRDLAIVLHGFSYVFAVLAGLPPSHTQVSRKAQIETMVVDMLAE
ncbi:hypothetical protein Tco_0478722, partial [Tanacetum coccineum]